MWLNSVEEKTPSSTSSQSFPGIPKFINPQGAWCLAVASCHDIICPDADIGLSCPMDHQALANY
jgi:hypothetical protein